MSSFMKWLYRNYIFPQLVDTPKTGYEQSFSVMDTDLMPSMRQDYENTLEFTAIHAFALGFKTGKGLSQSIPNL